MSSAGSSRDAGVRRLSRVTKWVAVGAVALTGVVAVVAAQTLPGKAQSAPASPAQNPTAGSDTTPTTAAPSDPNGFSGGIQAPLQAPRETRRSHSVVSGGT